MVVMKMTHMEHIPKYCDDCIYYGCKPHPYKGWSESCELCMQCMDDDQDEGWMYDGNGRPKNCPLMEIKAESEDCISREDALMALTGEWTESRDELIPKFISRIKVLPSVEPVSNLDKLEDKK